MEKSDGESMRTMHQQVDRLLLRYALIGIFSLILLAALPLFYQLYLLVAPASSWMQVRNLYVFVDPKDSIQKMMLEREIADPPLSLKTIWKVRDATTDQPLCYREITATFDKSESVASPIDQFLRTCDRTKWVGKRLSISGHFTFGLQYGIQKELFITAPPFKYVGDGHAATS